ncbi:MAG: DUF4258 domain-containing protein [Bacteroidetes bacterium]|jgi:hypothetical protein|nr:DUF4258 domain-containing protein [Bacteroidota bacterium]
MFENFITKTVKNGRIKWQRHALQRMLERDIYRKDVKEVLSEGDCIEKYVDDTPFPSGLFLGFVDGSPLHVVAAIDKESECCYVITAYHPDSEHFKDDYKTRR